MTSLSRERIEAAKARADAATEGPWARYGDGDHEVYSAVEYSNGESGPYVAKWCRDAEDAEFIAAARNDVPEMADALLRVLNMHRLLYQYGGRKHTCAWCGSLVTYPCATVRAITGEENGQ